MLCAVAHSKKTYHSAGPLERRLKLDKFLRSTRRLWKPSDVLLELDWKVFAWTLIPRSAFAWTSAAGSSCMFTRVSHALRAFGVRILDRGIGTALRLQTLNMDIALFHKEVKRGTKRFHEKGLRV